MYEKVYNFKEFQTFICSRVYNFYSLYSLHFFSLKKLIYTLKSLTFSFLFMISFTSVSQEVSAPKFGKGLLNIQGKDSTWTMNFSARVQYLTSTTWKEGGDSYGSPESNSLIRRSRLKFKGFAYDPKLTYKIELALSNRDISGGSFYTCLLYTSPSPRDLSTSRMPSSA